MSNRFIPLNSDGFVKRPDDFGTKNAVSVSFPSGMTSQITECIFPDNTVKQVREYTFYCNSAAKSIITEHPDVIAQGDGTRENPFVDVNYSLDYLCCEAAKMCDNCFALRLIVTGTVNYVILPHDGNSCVFVDMTAATVEYDLPDDFVGYGMMMVLKNISFKFNSIYITDLTNLGVQNVLFERCEGCRINFKTVNFTANGGRFAEDCIYCTFEGGNIEYVTTSSDYAYSYFRIIYQCDNCVFENFNMHIALNETVNCYGFSYCNEVSFINCICTIDISVDDWGSRPFHGCGFADNDNPTWIGENTGYVYYYDSAEDILQQYMSTNQNCSSTPPSSSIPPSSEEPPSSSSSSSGGVSHKGSILCHAFTRSISYRLFATTYKEDKANGKQDCYVVDVSFNWEHPHATAEAEISKYHGFIGRLDCESDVDEDGNDNGEWICWGECGCDEGKFYASADYDVEYFEKPASLADAAADSANKDVTKWINGTLYELPEPDDIPVDKTGWFGFKNYCRSGSLHHISPHTLTKKDDTLTAKTKTEASFYGAWGEYPCYDGDGSASIALDTYVFEWRPDDDNDTKKPKYLILEDADGNEIRCEFMTEYCLQGNADVDRDMVSLTTCNQISGLPDDNVHCNFVVVKGTTRLYDLTQNGVQPGWEGKNYPKPTRILSRTYKYKGVKF